MDLIIKDVLGQQEMLTGFEVERKNVVNGDKTIKVTVIKSETNEHAYPLMRNESVFMYDGDEYIIKKFKENTIGKTTKVTCDTVHRMFDDLKHNYIYNVTSGTVQLETLLAFILEGTGYTFTCNVTASIPVDKFGDDNSLALFKDIIDRVGIEFDINGTHFTISDEIARYTDDQFRYRYNIQNPSREIDTSNFATYIRGFGKEIEAEYTSPLADVYGIKHAEPVRDERYTDSESLQNRLKRELNDSLEVSINLTYLQMLEQGIQNSKKGDYLWLILDPFDIDVRIRIIEVTDYSSPTKSPNYTLGKLRSKGTDVLAKFNQTSATVNNVVDIQTQTVKDSSLSSDLNFVLEAILSTFEQVDYTERGIVVSDPNDFMRRLEYRKGGLYRTTNGNYFYPIATPDGLNLEQVYGILAPEHVSVGLNTTFDTGYDPTEKVAQTDYDLHEQDYQAHKNKIDTLYWMGGV